MFSFYGEEKQPMSSIDITQELIIVSKTGFTRKRPTSKNGFPQDSNTEQITKDPLWSTKVTEIIPEIFLEHTKNTPLFLYHLKEYNHVYTDELADFPQEMDFEKSIDPYFFLELQSYN